MPRILLIETASPKRILEKADKILQSGRGLEIFILCNQNNRHFYGSLEGVTVRALSAPSRYRSIPELIEKPFDAIYCFWTGEKRFRQWKQLGIWLKARQKFIISGDGNEFRLTWKAYIRHAVFRLRHPLPTDHRNYAEQQAGYQEQILVLQSAEPAYVLEALNRLKDSALFINPCYTIFCRNKPEIVNSFRNHPMLQRMFIHFEARESLKHLSSLRRNKYDAAILFLTGDPSYWKVKLFAFLLGTRRILIFNESSDCFFFNLHQWLTLISHRIRIQSGDARTIYRSRWGHSIRILVSLVLKSVLLPFRFLWLLLVWVRLRSAGLKSSRERHDYPL